MTTEHKRITKEQSEVIACAVRDFGYKTSALYVYQICNELLNGSEVLNTVYALAHIELVKMGLIDED